MLAENETVRLPTQRRVLTVDEDSGARTYIVEGETPPLDPYEESGAILVWRFREAPPWMCALSELRGGEVWVAYVPARLSDPYPPLWLEDLANVTDYHILPNGARIAIAAY